MQLKIATPNILISRPVIKFSIDELSFSSLVIEQMEEDQFMESVLFSYRNNNWLDLLSLDTDENYKFTRKLVWVWLSVDNLLFLKRICMKFGIEGITSVGCGCGLLEWIINRALNLPVTGLEVNPEWWESRYSGHKFIKLKFPEFPLQENYLDPSSALLFCYFNDEEAFKSYVLAYRGIMIIIIGPDDGIGRYTCPAPFKPFLEDFEWKLDAYQEVKSTGDYIAVYVRKL